MATIATHNGTKIAREHNVRNPKVVSKEEHIDPNGHSEIWKDELPRKAYERLFGDAVKKYNSKQKRADRKITDYYKKICEDSKKHPCYEMIVGVYDRSLSYETKRKILKAYVDGWNERNPNLELIGAYFHADEPGAEEHLHLDYIPVARNCKRGLETQTALVKALEQQGISPGETMKETCQILWEAKENKHLEELCLSMGVSVEHPMRDGKKSRKHLQTEVFKLTKEKENLEAEKEMLRNENEELRLQVDILTEQATVIDQEIDAKRECLSIAKEREELTILDRFWFYVSRLSIADTLKNFVGGLLDKFEEEERGKTLTFRGREKETKEKPKEKLKEKSLDRDDGLDP